MSTLLEQASLIMIPSGYKEDVVYSVIPETGAGDLSFTRASNGTRVNSAGLVEVVAWNLLEQSETFTSGWNPVNTTVTANTTTAPNGTTTADTFTLTASSDSSIYRVVNGVSNNYTTFVYAKYVSGGQYLYLFSPLNSQGAKVWFDIQNGTVSNQLSGFTGTIEDAGNGWYKCSMYNTTQSVLDYIQFGISTTNSSRTLSNNSVAYFWGAQVNIGTTKPYFPTTDRLNVPRLTYQNGGGGCPSLLLEKQSTNYARNNNDLTGWTKITGTDTISLNAGTSPDGTSNGINLIPSTANGTHMFYDGSTSVSSSGNFTMTCYAKANGYSKFSMRESASVGYYASFNLSNGTVLDNGGNTASIENLGNGWYRCICSVVASTSVQIGLLVLSDSYTSGQPFGLTWSGDGTKGILTYGAQLEVSTSYATSLISTAGVASATRVADACIKTGISSLIGQSEGTAFLELNLTHSTTGANGYLMQLYYDGTNRIILYRDGASGCLSYYFLQGANVFNYISGISSNARHKLAFAYKTGDSVFYIDGAQVDTDATTFSAFSSLAELHIGANFNPTQTELGDYNYNEAIIFPTRLTNAELASLTTL